MLRSLFHNIALTIRNLSAWEAKLEESILDVNDIYQNSGVNVEFRVVSVESFSNYKGPQD